MGLDFFTNTKCSSAALLSPPMNLSKPAGGTPSVENSQVWPQLSRPASQGSPDPSSRVECELGVFSTVGIPAR